MKYRLLFFFFLFMISGCSFSSTQAIEPAIIQTSSTSPIRIPTSSLMPTVTVSPAPTLSPTFPPYTGEPFSIVFLRGGNLWLANIADKIIERQLTFESPDMRIISFDISPDRTRIAYIPYRLEPLNSLIKLIELSTGATQVLLGENDPFSEVAVVWLDNNRIAYKSQDHLVPTFTTELVDNPTTYIIYDLSTERQIETTAFDHISPSPDGRFWLTCVGRVEGCHTFTLYNLANDQESKIGKNLKWVNSAEWSPDSRFMLFRTNDSPDDCTGQLVLINSETLEERLIVPEDKTAGDAEIFPSGEFLVYEQSDVINSSICERGEPEYWQLNLNDFTTQVLSANFEKNIWDVTWSPDGRHLIFFYGSYAGREHDLWSMNLDSSDLQPLLASVEEFRIISSPP
jgi:Tol biopolymer transport system component